MAGIFRFPYSYLKDIDKMEYNKDRDSITYEWNDGKTITIEAESIILDHINSIFYIGCDKDDFDIDFTTATISKDRRQNETIEFLNGEQITILDREFIKGVEKYNKKLSLQFKRRCEALIALWEDKKKFYKLYGY